MAENTNGNGKKYDAKQLGLGGIAGGGLVSVLMMVNSQNIDLIQQKQEAISNANAKRIDSLEETVKGLNNKIDAGFESLRNQNSANMASISSQLQFVTGDRFTKTEHNSYATSVESRIRRLEDRLSDLQKNRNTN